MISIDRPSVAVVGSGSLVQLVKEHNDIGGWRSLEDRWSDF